jgi:hypothetical protein
MVTGHRNVQSYLYRFKVNEAPNYPCGNDNQTVEHILLECAIINGDQRKPDSCSS